MLQVLFVEGIGNVTVCKRRNCRSMRLTISPEKGLLLSIPFSVSYANAERFVVDNKQWIENTLNKQIASGKKKLFTPESKFHCRQTLLSFHTTNDTKKILTARIKDYNVIITYNPQYVDFSLLGVQKFIKKVLLVSMQKEAEIVLFQRVKALSEQTNLHFTKVSIGNAKSRWGSCNTRDEIILSCRLLLLPDYLIDFIILHELCHIVHKNHGEEFHKLLNSLVQGKEQDYDKELKKYNGSLLPDN